jgi:hypothetical protein
MIKLAAHREILFRALKIKMCLEAVFVEAWEVWEEWEDFKAFSKICLASRVNLRNDKMDLKKLFQELNLILLKL